MLLLNHAEELLYLWTLLGLQVHQMMLLVLASAALAASLVAGLLPRALVRMRPCLRLTWCRCLRLWLVLLDLSLWLIRRLRHMQLVIVSNVVVGRPGRAHVLLIILL